MVKVPPSIAVPANAGPHSHPAVVLRKVSSRVPQRRPRSMGPRFRGGDRELSLLPHAGEFRLGLVAADKDQDAGEQR
jgi:hypothetical protein